MRKIFKGLLWTIVSAMILGLLGWGGMKYFNASPRKTVSEEGTKIYVEGLSFYDGNDKIVGNIYKPQDSTGRKPVVIWCHGLGENLKNGDKLCRYVAGKGYIAYTFDFRGGSWKSQSTGDPLKMSVLTEMKDLETVIGKIRQSSFCNGDIYVIGHSQGAFVAALEASGEKGVKGMVLMAPAFNIPDICDELYPKNRQIKDSTDFAGSMVVGKNYITDAKGIKPYKGLSKFKGDVLIIQGTADQTVPAEYASKAALEFKSAKLELIDGAGHSFTGKNADKVLALVGDFLDSHNK